MFRDKTKKIKIGNLTIGGGSPIAVQSMTKTATSDIDATVAQIHNLEETGCQIVRCAVPDEAAALALKEIKRQINIPLVADIHFNHRYAIMAAEAGVDKLRINPGNIGDLEKIKAVVAAATAHRIPIRVGVNAGSLERDIKKKARGKVTAAGLVQSALRNVKILEKLKFTNIVVSLKATHVPLALAAHQLIAARTKYPLHVGITESGIPATGIIRSSVGIGAILAQGLGDTIRVSLTGAPEEEVRVGYEILKSLELVKQGITIISCPTCGRCDIDVEKIAAAVAYRVRHITKSITVAIMGCEVNGPGEAVDADIGLAGGHGVGLIFRKGKFVKKVAEADMIEELVKEILEIRGRKKHDRSLYVA
ncbi:flavodoxin-dependent (E)-4-hydroxy-3-methylbut-2-enyl-diphosphate synthase [Candidatus Saganbacteria bacterium]|nr:flavodoxin-dependent (E)-4-hydroxy-3-methylbut-2-enyl-diphosphate synthase [Candidatus Saganbacteria bacterium]